MISSRLLPAAAVILCGQMITAGARQDHAAAAKSSKPGVANHMVYDAQRRQVLLVTSSTSGPRSEDVGHEQLWAWDGKRWTLVDDAGPPARELGAAAYDMRRNRLVLYGGMGRSNRDDRRGDTWEWDGRAWHQAPDTGIGTRDHHVMAFDEARGQCVTFGGVRTGETLETGTWQWDGRSWTQAVTEGPPGRAHSTMTYDSARKEVLLFGGLGERYKALTDLWSWNGSRWRKLTDVGPTPRTHHRMAFDSGHAVAVVFGGLKSGRPREALGDTWLWDGTNWTEAPAPGPAARSGHVMAYDAARRRLVLYGGGSWDGKVVTRYDDTWEWDGKAWIKMG